MNKRGEVLLGIGLGLAAIGATWAAARRSTRKPLGAIRNADDAHRAVNASKAQLDAYEARARGAGAKGELTFIGAGMEGFVLCDEAGSAFKVARGSGDHLADEARWFQTAREIPSIKQHVPAFARYDAKERVLIRECLVPRGGSRASGKRLWDLHERLTKTVAPYGHGRPEFKLDSYVYTKRGPVLVDAGLAVNRGRQLVKEVQAALKKDALSAMDANDLAFALRIERDGTIPAPIANRLLERLKAREPSVEL